MHTYAHTLKSDLVKKIHFLPICSIFKLKVACKHLMHIQHLHLMPPFSKKNLYFHI